eukprot:35001_1
MELKDHLLSEKYLMYALETCGFMIINELCITKECTISLHNTDNIESRMKGLISQYEFKVSYDGDDHLLYTCPDITQFNITIPQNETSVTNHLFCRPTHVKDSAFIHIKSF